MAFRVRNARAGDYYDGADERINASRFETKNSQFSAAYRRGNHLFEAQAALQHIPYEGFPNADMDMQGNIAAFFDARYSGGYAWGELHIHAFYDHIRHAMNGNAQHSGPSRLKADRSIRASV